MKTLRRRLADIDKLRRRYLQWQNAHLSQGMVLILVSLVLGVFTGMAAATLKSLIRFFGQLLMIHIDLGRPNIRLLIFPLAGILLTSIFQMYVIQGSVSRGTRIIRTHLDDGKYCMSPFTVFNPIIGCGLTIGFGASGGSEGPTALSGAAIGSSVGRLFGLSKSWLRLLMGIGGGAGIAAIFKSPVGGVLFTLEVLQMEMTTLPVLALVIACLISSTTAYLLSDFTFDIFFDNTIPFDPSTIGMVALLGVFCGLYSIYYNVSKHWTTRVFTSIKNPWWAAIVTGSILSVGAFLFPVLYGEGFYVIETMVNSQHIDFTVAGLFAGQDGTLWIFVSLVSVLLLKGILVSASYGGGGVAGDFVPTFFAGAFAGYLFALTINTLFGAHLPIWFYALTGMGCVMAGTIHAPLMSIFLLCETTNTYGYIFPYLIAIAISYGTVKFLTPKSWYEETGHDDWMALMKLRQSPSLRSRLEVRSEGNKK